uniref:C-type lectin domain-containing protein n=1 Tax=Caenorhabditis tropicalis TaxID=1561998 RepID=A0A1I7T6Z6_9PELO
MEVAGDIEARIITTDHLQDDHLLGKDQNVRPTGTLPIVHRFICFEVGIGHLTYPQAQAQCNTYGGVLSGIQNDWERQLIANESVRQLIPHNVNLAGVWLGASKIPGTNSFQWNDGHTTGAVEFYGPGQPDNALGDPRGPQNCLQLIVMAPNYWNSPDKWRTFPRLIDDYWCHMAHDPAQRMYACGKRGPSDNTIG